MKEYKNCIIAFLDILGFKQIINQSEFSEVLNIFNKIMTKDEISIALQPAISNENPEQREVLARYRDSLDNTGIYVMSDSVVVYTPDLYPESLAVVVDICDVIQEQLFNLDNPVLIRGALSVGAIFCDEGLIFGKGLVDAYLAQERYAVYPRVIISNEIVTGRRVSIHSDDDLPKDKDDYYRINSIERYLSISYADNWRTIEESQQYQKLNALISKNLNGYTDEHIRQKYIWLKNTVLLIRKNIEAKEGRLFDLTGIV